MQEVLIITSYPSNTPIPYHPSPINFIHQGEPDAMGLIGQCGRSRQPSWPDAPTLHPSIHYALFDIQYIVILQGPPFCELGVRLTWAGWLANLCHRNGSFFRKDKMNKWFSSVSGGRGKSQKLPRLIINCRRRATTHIIIIVLCIVKLWAEHFVKHKCFSYLSSTRKCRLMIK